VAQPVDSQVRRGLEQIRAQEPEHIRLIQAQQAGVGLLRDFFGFLSRLEARLQESHQVPIVLDEQTSELGILW
jgi:hypothetical protein